VRPFPLTPPGAVARVLAAQGLRAAGYGFTAVLLGGLLAARGYSHLRAGVLLAAMVAGTSWVSVLVGVFADRWGRRRSYAALGLVLAGSGGVYAGTDAYPLLVAVALAGMLSTDVIDNGPATTLEQAILAGPGRPEARRYAAYNAVAALAGSAGALAAGLPGLAARPALFAVLVPVGLATAALAVTLPPTVEPAGAGAAANRPTAGGLGRSRRTVAGLAGLFAVDAFAGGFVVQSFIAYWLAERFGVGLDRLGPLFAGLGLLQAVSFLAAGRLADRIGLLPTMVFTHLPSNLLLAAVPLIPAFPAAAALLAARALLSQMDVPTRQAYVMALVDPAERTAAAAATNTARYTLRPLGPLLAGAAQHLAAAAPFLLAGALKTGYDLALWAWFRTVPLSAETTPSPPTQP